MSLSTPVSTSHSPTTAFNTTVAIVEGLHAEATKLVLRHTRLRRDIAEALEYADQAMDLAQAEQAIQTSDGPSEDVVAAADLVAKCARLQALCFDLLADAYSPGEEYEHAAYGRKGRGRGIDGLVGDDDCDDVEESHVLKKGKKIEKVKRERQDKEEELELSGALWELELSDDEESKPESTGEKGKAPASESPNAPTVAASRPEIPPRRSIKFSDEVVPEIRKRAAQYFKGRK